MDLDPDIRAVPVSDAVLDDAGRRKTVLRSIERIEAERSCSVGAPT